MVDDSSAASITRGFVLRAIAVGIWGLGLGLLDLSHTTVRSQDASPDPHVDYQRGEAHFAGGRYVEALSAFEAASHGDPEVAIRATKGKVRTALRIAEFDLAYEDAERLAAAHGADPEALALLGDARWAMGRFDEAEAAYRRAAAINPESSRARHGLARALASWSQLDEALDVTRAAMAAAPHDADLRALAGVILERLGRYDEAAEAYGAYADLLPPAETAAMATARARAQFLRSFRRRVPLQVSARAAAGTHTVPFKLVNNKVVVQGRLNGERVEWVLDTGAERTGISPEMASRARIQPIAATVAAGVGRSSVRRIQLARADRLDLGTLQIRNVPLAIRNPALEGAPRWQGETLSPLALGMSVAVDYGRRRVTFARELPDAPADITLPLRLHRLPLVRGTLNASHPAYFVVDTGGEVISISAATADALGMQPPRHIPLRVFGMSGLDESAFLLPGVDLDFEAIAYRNVSLAVLNLRMPSVLLGFQVGGIVGHRFLGEYHVAFDVGRSELRLAKF